MSEPTARLLDPDRIRFVLVEPQRAGNVGSAARALANLGFSRLEIVRPAGDPRDSEARRMAVNAWPLLDAAGVHPTLDSALAGAQTVVGTTARTGKQRKPHWRIDALAEHVIAKNDPGELAIVFGREDHGLNDEDLVNYCQVCSTMNYSSKTTCQQNYSNEMPRFHIIFT